MLSRTSKNFNSNFLSTYFSTLTDPRRTEKGNLKHLMSDILLLTLTSIICGLTDYDEIIYFGNQEMGWFKKHGDFSKGIPSKDTIRRFFSALDPVAFSSCFMDWVGALREADKTDTIAIDGKTIRGASTKSDPKSITPHIISAMATEQGLCLGQLKVADKSNEITAIPELLDLLSISGDTITIDAMGCQGTIVDKIVDKGANYIIAVKGNQKELELAINDTVLLEHPTEVSVTEDCGHGRVERRTCRTYDNLSHLQDVNKWPGLSTFIEIRSEVYHKSTGKATDEKRLYISNLKQSASVFNDAIRKHWAIENQIHWVLDVTFKEDQARKRAGHLAENFNIIFKTALTLINNEKSYKKSKKSKRLRALMDREYREKILNL